MFNTVCLFVEVRAGGFFAKLWFVFVVDVPAGAICLENIVVVICEGFADM